jgi:competence protein ComGC
MHLKEEKGVTLLVALIIILMAGIIAVLVIPQLKEKEKGKIETLCRSQMVALSKAEFQHFNQKGTYTDSLSLLVPLIPQTIAHTCPLDGAGYMITATDSTGFVIECPNGHGSINNGQPDWLE